MVNRAFIIVVAALVVAGCSGKADRTDPSPVIAAVNGEPITLGQFKDRLEFANLGFENVSGNRLPDDDMKMDLLSQLIEESMYIQEAEKLGITVSGAEVQKRLDRLKADYPPGVFDNTVKRTGLNMRRFREELRRKLLVEKLIEAEVYSSVKVGPDELEGYYEEHKKEFHRPARVRARQIVVDSESEAGAILAELSRGADFEELAKTRSFSPDGASGGDLGYFARGEMPPEFEEVVFDMEPGQTSGVVKTPYGYHIFRMEDVQEAMDPTFEDVKSEVRKRVVAIRGEDAFKKWQGALKDRTGIQLDLDALGKI